MKISILLSACLFLGCLSQVSKVPLACDCSKYTEYSYIYYSDLQSEMIKIEKHNILEIEDACKLFTRLSPVSTKFVPNEYFILYKSNSLDSLIIRKKNKFLKINGKGYMLDNAQNERLIKLMSTIESSDNIGSIKK